MKTALVPWLAVGQRAERALLQTDPDLDLGDGGMRGAGPETSGLQLTGARLDAVEPRSRPARSVVRVDDVFAALAWLATARPRGCVVAAEAVAERPRDALRALQGQLGRAPLLLLDEPGFPEVREAALGLETDLFPAPRTGSKLARSLDYLDVPPVDDTPNPPASIDATFPDGCLEYIDDPEGLCHFVLYSLRNVSGAERITLLLRDPERPTLSLEAGRGVNRALLGKVRCPMGTGIAGRVASLGRPIVGRGSTGGSRDYESAAYAVLPLGSPRDCEGVACLTGFPADEVPTGEAIQMWLGLARRAGLALSAARRLQRAQAESTHDPLTRLPNRRAFERALPRELERAQRASAGLAVAIFDVDHFKRCNDDFGHEAGDRALVEIAKRMKDALRETDLVARWGGEEFAVLLPDLERGAGDEAFAAAERARQRVAARPIVLGPGLPAVRVTISGGLALHPAAGRDAPSLVRAADRALFEAKAAGRNRIRRA